MIPAPESLVAAANEHFAFFSAEEDLQDDDEGQGEFGLADLQQRVGTMEATMQKLAEGMSQLLGERSQERQAQNQTGPAPRAVTRPPALRKPGQAPVTTSMPRVQFPTLDQGVVQAALQAGVPAYSLAQMEKLISQNTKAKKAIEPNKDVVLDPLSEHEEEGLVEVVGPGESGSPPPGNPLAATLSKLTDIMSLLAEDKKKAKGTPKLDIALDSAQGSSSSDGLSLGAGKKTAAARRALRSTFLEHPEEIYNNIEKFMYEDLASQTLGPGQQPLGLNARAWVEFRSRITSYKTGAHCAWCFAGILDAMVAGRYDLARARACLWLLQLDQAAIDRGNWTLAAGLSLEQSPPMTALASHQGPNVQDGESPFSRLLDARWAEVILGHLRDQDEFVTKRRNIGKQSNKNTEENEESSSWESRRRPKAKPKAKASTAAEKAGDA